MSQATASSIDWPHELSGGLIAGTVAVVYALSYAALLCSGPLRELLPLAVGMCLVSAFWGALWLALRSELRFAIGGPDGSTLSILGAMAAAGAALPSTAAGANAASQLVALLLANTLACAAVFLALGFLGLGRSVRYIPYPVVGGFLASTGWLIVTGALAVVAADAPPALSALQRLPHYLADPRVALTVALALVYQLVLRRWRHPALLPAMLLGATAGFFAVLALAGVPVAAAREAGWLFESAGELRWAAPWQLLAEPARLPDWHWLAGQWLDSLAVVSVATITVLLGSSGLEIMARRDISLDGELRSHGWLNLLTAASGGVPSLVSVSRSTVLLESGAKTRAAGVLAAAVCVLAASGAAWLLGWIPKVVPAAFLLYLGLSILHEWLVASRQRLGRSDWALIVLIVGITATIGFTFAVLAGIVASSLSFAVTASRIGVVQHDLDGSALQSPVARPAAHRDALVRRARNLRVLVLHGAVFFGTAHTVLERVRGFLAAAPARRTGARVLVLDFAHVASTDSAAGLTFAKIAQLAAASGVRLLFSGVGSAAEPALAQARDSGASEALECFETLEQALEAAENGLLVQEGLQPDAPAESLAQWLERELGGCEHMARLQPLLQRLELAPDQVLLRQHEPSNATLYLIESGRLGVRLEKAGAAPHEQRRIASVMGGTLVGEMALYSSAPRSATVVAESGSVVWALPQHALEALQASAPDTVTRVHGFLMRTMAERIRAANRTIGALQRGG